MALAAGDAWLDKGANLLLLGRPAGDHLAAALSFALVENGWRVVFAEPPTLSSGCNRPP